MLPEEEQFARNPDEEDYGTPAYSALEGSGFGFTRVLYGQSAQAEERSRSRRLNRSEAERLAELRSLIAQDRSLDARGVEATFGNDGALHLEGYVADERTWFAVVNLASHVSRRVVDRIEVHARKPG
jgi:hypothetical protein